MLEDKMIVWVDRQEAAATGKAGNLDALDYPLLS
jgi:hypothetical protein